MYDPLPSGHDSCFFYKKFLKLWCHRSVVVVVVVLVFFYKKWKFLKATGKCKVNIYVK